MRMTGLFATVLTLVGTGLLGGGPVARAETVQGTTEPAVPVFNAGGTPGGTVPAADLIGRQAQRPNAFGLIPVDTARGPVWVRRTAITLGGGAAPPPPPCQPMERIAGLSRGSNGLGTCPDAPAARR